MRSSPESTRMNVWVCTWGTHIAAAAAATYIENTSTHARTGTHCTDYMLILQRARYRKRGMCVYMYIMHKINHTENEFLYRACGVQKMQPNNLGITCERISDSFFLFSSLFSLRSFLSFSIQTTTVTVLCSVWTDARVQTAAARHCM